MIPSSTSTRWAAPAARAEPVRRRPGGLPDRPGRRRLRLPVRDPRCVQGRHRAGTGRLRRRCGAQRRCSPNCAPRPRAEHAAPAPSTAPARAAAWRRSSSPACRLTGPIPSASRGTAPAGCARPGTQSCRERTRTTPRFPPRRRPGPWPWACRGARPGEALRLKPAGGHVVTATLTEPVGLGPRRAPSRVMFGPHETNLGQRPGHLGAARRLLRAAGGGGLRRHRDRDRQRAPVGLALRARAAGRGLRAGLGPDRRRLRAARSAGAGRARPRRDAGLLGILPVRAVGTVAGSGCRIARAAHGDGGRGDRRAGGRLRGRRRPGRRIRAGRRGDQRRPVLSCCASSSPG